MIAQSGSQNTGSQGGNGAQPGFNATDFLSAIFGGTSGSSSQAGGGFLDKLNAQTNASALGTSAIGGLVGAFLCKGSLRGAASGALIGGGLQLLNQYRNRIKQEAQAKTSGPSFDVAGAHSNPDEREARIIRAIVYAAKSDGHIDEQEKQKIDRQVQQLQLGTAAENLVRTAMDEPLDAQRIEQGVQNPDEALEVFVLSCSVLDVDNSMQRYYLTSLAEALNIPADVSEDLINKIHQ